MRNYTKEPLVNLKISLIIGHKKKTLQKRGLEK